ncbi:IS3 family transposase, IstA [Candidatus Phytoplasma rubi]|uniref:IS3 family transposase, IstA n=1 Tax=Candidatus Phytoplasma rubi TaxID=399025 RepID=A0ABY7BRU0_9MOLU|nr:IS3 family transposase, IstA [Candidatus Phytoplasma rubi]
MIIYKLKSCNKIWVQCAQPLTQNIKVNSKTVYFKMKKFYLLCQTRKNHYLKCHNNNYYIPISQLNLLKNNFQSTQSYQKLYVDFTYLFYEKTKILYLSVIMDLYNKEILSYYLSCQKRCSFSFDTFKPITKFKKTCSFSFGPRC